MRDARRHSALPVLAAAVALTLTACATSEDGGAEGPDRTVADEGLAVDDNGVSTFTPPRDGSDLPAPVAELSAADAAALLFMREEERLALDVYDVLAETWGLPVFSNIAGAEATHTDAVRVLLERYDLDDPVPSRDAGEFSNAELQAAYDEFVALGTRSLEDALRVGAMIEELDIADLRARPADAPDVAQVFDNLERGSRNHLRAFVGQLDQRGFDHTATHLTQAEVDEILSGDVERGGA